MMGFCTLSGAVLNPAINLLVRATNAWFGGNYLAPNAFTLAMGLPFVPFAVWIGRVVRRRRAACALGYAIADGDALEPLLPHFV